MKLVRPAHAWWCKCYRCSAWAKTAEIPDDRPTKPNLFGID
jgi:hypothetical protein